MNTIEMVDIPAGTFLMGSLEEEGYKDERPQHYDDECYDDEYYDNEYPQHEVSVPQFFMAKTPVTQAQWRIVAEMPKVEHDLNPGPSHFKGANRPVEQVSWYEAMEFCQRLSAHTGKHYTLPTEAQWEYACRAGTDTPFYFGETITAELASYDCEQTTPVGKFPANDFGLFDLHGNVLEWCLDHWHPSYKGAPTDGSAWVKGGDEGLRMLRGGSWSLNPRNCRSAYRHRGSRANRCSDAGFRVVSLY